MLRAQNPAGQYELVGEREVGSELLLRADGRFDYGMASGAVDYQAQGTWKKEGTAVLLTTDRTTAPPFRLLRSFASKEPGTRVWVKAPNGHGVPNIDVAIGDQQVRTSSAGVAQFEPGLTGAVKILIPVYRLEAGRYPLQAGHTDHEFEINGPAITSVRFQAERLPIVGGELHLRFWNRDKVMRYVRVK